MTYHGALFAHLSVLDRIGRLYGNVQAQPCLPNTPNTAWPVLMFNISRHFRQREQHKCATAELRTLVELNQDQPCRRLDHIQPTTGSDLRSLQKVVTSRPIRRLPLQVHSKQPIQQESQALMHQPSSDCQVLYRVPQWVVPRIATTTGPPRWHSSLETGHGNKTHIPKRLASVDPSQPKYLSQNPTAVLTVGCQTERLMASSGAMIDLAPMT